MILSVSIWSDIACPWCYVGKRRFESAVEVFQTEKNAEVRVTWKSFELDPKRSPKVSESYVGRLARKYEVTECQAQRMIDNMVATGAQEGIEFNFESAVWANTFDAHRLLQWAKNGFAGEESSQKQSRLKQELLAAHFEQGADVGATGQLLEIVSQAQLPVDEAAAVLSSDDYAEHVRKDEEEARRRGISGVPFFAVEGFGVSGAQRQETILEVLRRAHLERNESASELLSASVSQGAACTPKECAAAEKAGELL